MNDLEGLKSPPSRELKLAMPLSSSSMQATKLISNEFGRLGVPPQCGVNVGGATVVVDDASGQNIINKFVQGSSSN